ncbi:hypothetical protein C8F01DRAFT_1255396 [Mycena amicta]|nr:hypothetical protein C8F01DRAFT_1255396 [Mycena amicta]
MSSKGHDLDENSGCNNDRVEKRPVHMDVVESPLAPLAASADGGGVQAWATVLGSFLIMFCDFGYSSSFGVYQDFYVRTYMPHSSPSAISSIGSVNIFIVLSGGFIAGRLHDRGYLQPQLRPHLHRLPPHLPFPLPALPCTHKLYQIFLSQGLAHALGSGTTYVPCIAVLSQHFSSPPRRALAMTLVASGSSLGAVVHPLMLNALLPRLAFGTAVRASAALVAGLLMAT